MDEQPPKKRKFVETFKQRLEDLREIKEGTWFTTLLKRVLHEHAKKSTADFFKHKYPALDPERVSNRLIKAASHAAGLSGVAAAAAVTAAELGAVETAGASLAVAVTSFAGEVSATTYFQLCMVYDISVVFEAPFDPNDPEDLITIFWYSFGVNKWEDVTNAFAKGGPRTTEYLGRKALRSGIRSFFQKVAEKLGGQKLARVITERALLKLIVPGVNLPIAYGANVWFTRKLGRVTISHLKRRSAVVRSMKKLGGAERKYQLLLLGIIYHIGINPEDPSISSYVVEMQDIVTRRLQVKEPEEAHLEWMIAKSLEEFLSILDDCKSDLIRDVFLEVGMVSHVLSKASAPSRGRLNDLAARLDRSVNENALKDLRQELAV